MNKKFYVVCDASEYDVGSVLMQEYGDRLEPVEFFSKMFGPSERCWHVSEKELVAIVWSLEKWSKYLLANKFQVFTDHKNLQAVMNPFHKGLLAAKLGRWLIRIQEFDFECNYITGINNVVADSLSRDILREGAEEMHDKHSTANKIDGFEKRGFFPKRSEKRHSMFLDMKERANQSGLLYDTDLRLLAENEMKNSNNLEDEELNCLKNSLNESLKQIKVRDFGNRTKHIHVLEKTKHWTTPVRRSPRLIMKRLKQRFLKEVWLLAF